MFPDNVETITMTKDDYDRNVEQLLLEKLELEQKCEAFEEEIKKITKVLEKDNRVSLGKYNKLKREKEQLELTLSINKNYRVRNEKAIKLLKEAGCYDEDTKTFCDDIYYELPDILNALEGSDKE